MLSPAKTILMMSDEVLYIYASSYKGVSFVDVVPWDSDSFVDDVTKIITKECNGKQIIILNDMVEQHYRKERVPKVSPLDKANVVKRKLNIAFPNYPVRAALPLKEKVAKTENTVAANVYIFAASPMSEQFQKTMRSSRQSLATISGFCMLPVESADMVKALSAKLSEKGQPKPKWCVLMGQHKSGGLRQVVVKDGELALTRMTPIAGDDVDVEGWASDVSQEFQATMSYMARFGYVEEDGLDLIVIANPESENVLEDVLDIGEGNLRVLTVGQAAKHLGLNVSVAESQRYADILHVGWVAKKTVLTLPMRAQELESISRPRQMATLAMFALVLGGLYMSYQVFTAYSSLRGARVELEEVNGQLASLKTDYAREVEKKEALGFDVRLVQSSIILHDALELQDIDVLPLVTAVGKALGRDMRIDQFTVDRVKPESPGAMNSLTAALQGDFSKIQGQEQEAFVYKANIQVSYPSTTNVDKGNDEVRDLAKRLSSRLPEHEVKVEKFLKDEEYADDFVLDTSANNDVVAQDYVASITIKGTRK